MTTLHEPFHEPPALIDEGHPLWLSDQELMLLTDDELEDYGRLLEAEREGLGIPIEGSPGEIAAELTGGRELHPRHLQLVDEAYQRLERSRLGDTTCKRKLLIVMPPQHGKSMRTRWGSLHRLKNLPQDRIVVASAEYTLAVAHTRWCRNLIERDSREQQRLGLTTAPDHRSARDWDIAGQRGGMYAVGMGGSLTGRPADMLVIDDPVKNPKAVEKLEQRKAMWEWFTTVAMTRLSPNASVVVIMTRWHEDDLAGRILASDDADDWEVLHLPAICNDPATDLLGREANEALWPGRYDRDWLDKQKTLLGTRDFAALYQGEPVPSGGTLIKKHWFNVEADYPRNIQMLRYWDMAATSAEGGGDPDWTVGALLGLSKGRWWILDIERFRESPHGLKQRMAAVRDRDGRGIPIRAEQEPGSSGKLVVYELATTLFVGYDFRAKTSTGSKLLRAKPFLAAAEAGNITVMDRDWTSSFLDEAESFPFGHDDQIDACSGAMNWLSGPSEQQVVHAQQRWGHVQSRR